MPLATRLSPLLLATIVAWGSACGPCPDGGSPADSGHSTEVERLAEHLAARLTELDLDAVAVPDFQDARGDTSELGRYLAQKVSSALARALPAAGPDAPRVVDRHRIFETLAEWSFESGGLVEPSERRKGEISGVDALVTGKLVSFSDTFHLSIQVLDYEGGSAVLAVESADLPRTPRLSELEGRTLKVRRTENLDVTELWTDRPPLQSWPARRPETLEVDLQGCGRLEEAVYCLFAVRAVGQDRSVSVYGTSRAILPDGSQVAAAQVQVGASTATGPKGKAGDSLVEGVATAAALRFDDIPADIHRILRLTLALQGEDAELRDVPIERL